MTIKNSICLGTIILILAGCTTTDQTRRKECTSYVEEEYTEQVCEEVNFDCQYDASGRQMCRGGNCAKYVSKLVTRQVCESFVCKEGYVRHPDGNCYTHEEMSELGTDPDR
jgi:hypothetical protein